MFCSSLFFDDVNSNKIEEMLSAMIHTTRMPMIYLQAAMKETFRISDNALPISIRPFNLFFFWAHRFWRAKPILIGEVLTDNQLERRRVSIAQYPTKSPRTYLTSGHRRSFYLSWRDCQLTSITLAKKRLRHKTFAIDRSSVDQRFLESIAELRMDHKFYYFTKWCPYEGID